jgi:hypothetical protein
MSNRSKGKYYERKTKLYYEKKGYSVYNLEAPMRRIFIPNGFPIFLTKDVAGADLLAMNGIEIIFIQVKSNKKHISSGKKELLAHPFPPFVKKQVLLWEPRNKIPLIWEL